MSKDITNPRKSSLIEEPIKKIIVGVAGGSAAGKTTLCQNIFRQMAFDRNFKIQIISLDSFYKDVDKNKVDVTEYNWDHPNSLDFDLAYLTLKNLIESNEKVGIPQYSFVKNARQKQPIYVGPANIIFFQGLMAFHDKRIRDLLTYKIFINCDDDIRLCRRLVRDTTERGRSVTSVLEQYNKFVKNAYRDFILPTNVYADITIPGFRSNRVSVDFIVQHIKNISRRITFKEREIKTKTFIFGESQLYDLQCSDSHQAKIYAEQQSFLVFPTTSEHKRQLAFFMNTLLTEIFSVQYFHQIFIIQFIKVLKALFRQLINLQHLQSNQMEIISIYNLQQILKLESNKYSIKVIFFPVAHYQNSKNILSKLKQYLINNPKTTFIILNTFCDLTVPKIIYKLKLSNVVMINLFVIANDKRFRESMNNNITAVNTDNFDWFVHNHQICDEGVTIFAKEFNIYKRTQQQIAEAVYKSEIQKQANKITKQKVDQMQEKVGIIQQYNVYCQEHANLSGYHALSTLICLQTRQDIKSNFVQNYHLLANQINKIDYRPLELTTIQELLSSSIFHTHNSIGIIKFTSKYFLNTLEQIEELTKMFNQLIDQVKERLYVIIGVDDHYALLQVTKNRINFYDSFNSSLRDIMSGAQSSAHTLKQAIEIVLDLLSQKQLLTIVIEKRIDDIIGTFNLVKDDQLAINEWLKEYPKQKIEQDLMDIIKSRKVAVGQTHKKLIQNWLIHPSIKGILGETHITLY